MSTTGRNADVLVMLYLFRRVWPSTVGCVGLDRVMTTDPCPHVKRYISLTEHVVTWFERATMTVILLNCVTLGLYQPCADVPCARPRCYVLEAADHAIYAYFAVEMCIKVLAMGLVGQHTYLADGWNRLDFFIVIAGSVCLFCKSQIPLRYPGRRQVRSWSQTCSELEFGL